MKFRESEQSQPSKTTQSIAPPSTGNKFKDFIAKKQVAAQAAPNFDQPRGYSDWLGAELRRAAAVKPDYPFTTENLVINMLDLWRKVGNNTEVTTALFNSQIEPGQTSDQDSFDDSVRPLDIAKNFGWAYKDSPSNLKHIMIPYMLKSGLKMLGKLGEISYFSGQIHDSDEPVFAGDPVTIIEPGWITPFSPDVQLICSAKVKPVK